MVWIRSNTETARHPKVENLADALDICMAQAVGHLHMLWWWAMEYAADGDLSSFSNKKIARAAGWEGDADTFVNALETCGTRGGGFIDPKDGGGYTLHNWEERMGPLFKERVHNAERNRRYRERKNNAQCEQRDGCRDGYRDASRDGYRDGGQDKTDMTRHDMTDKTGRDETRLDTLALDFPDPEPLEQIAPADASAQEESDSGGGKGKRKRIPKPKVHEMPIQGAPYSGKAHDYFFAIQEFVPDYEPDAMREIRFIQDLMAQYPEKNIEAEFLKALGWCKDNPEKARKKKNLRQFMRNWMARAEPDPNRLFVPVPDTGIITGKNGGGVDGWA